jgi:hypothetical protein
VFGRGAVKSRSSRCKRICGLNGRWRSDGMPFKPSLIVPLKMRIACALLRLVWAKLLEKTLAQRAQPLRRPLFEKLILQAADRRRLVVDQLAQQCPLALIIGLG